MPYIYDPNLDEQQQQQQQQGGGHQISGAAPSGGGAEATATKPQTGSGFQNLDSYIKANNPRQFGQEVVGKVQQDVNEAKQSQMDATNQFKGQVESANKVPTSGDINSAIANPTGGTNAGDFQKWTTQSYAGPKNLAESPDAWNKYWSGTNKADTSTKLLGTEPGRFALLDSYYGRPSYSFGEKSLDNLLLQRGGVGQQARNLQGQSAQLKNQGSQQALALQKIATDRAGEVEAARKAARASLGIDENNNVIRGEGAGALGRTIEDSGKAAEAARTAAGGRFRDDLASGALSQSDWDALGIDPTQSLYDLNLNDAKYFSPGSASGKAATLSAEQKAQIKALGQLAGGSDVNLDEYLNTETAPPDFNFDKQALSNDLKARQDKYNADLNIGNVYGEGQAPVTMKQMKDFVDMIGGRPIDMTGFNPFSDNDFNNGKDTGGYLDYLERIQQFDQANQVGRNAGNYSYWGKEPPPADITEVTGRPSRDRNITYR